ncbi:hypothetical protein C8Q76DRAFT_732988 [Earliella scabrosa]|nr:hypothetical protein C8Q76DRAFT_732988 [Earliella scabrosa]
MGEHRRSRMSRGHGRDPRGRHRDVARCRPRGRSDGRLVHTYEHSLDRVACVLGGQAVHPPAFSFISAMLASHDWRL